VVEINIQPGAEGKRAMLGASGGALTKAGAEVMAAVWHLTYDGTKEQHPGGIAPDGRKSFAKFAEEGWMGLRRDYQVKPWQQAMELAILDGHEPPPEEGLWDCTFNWLEYYDMACGRPWADIQSEDEAEDEAADETGEDAENEEPEAPPVKESAREVNRKKYESMARVAARTFKEARVLDRPMDAYQKTLAAQIRDHGYGLGDLMEEKTRKQAG
jgi:hypothetical protein